MTGLVGIVKAEELTLVRGDHAAVLAELQALPPFSLAPAIGEWYARNAGVDLDALDPEAPDWWDPEARAERLGIPFVLWVEEYEDDGDEDAYLDLNRGSRGHWE